MADRQRDAAECRQTQNKESEQTEDAMRTLWLSLAAFAAAMSTTGQAPAQQLPPAIAAQDHSKPLADAGRWATRLFTLFFERTGAR